jgi:hypothetical protein
MYDYHFDDEKGNRVKLSAKKNDVGLEVTAEIAGEYPVTLCFKAMGEAVSIICNEESLQQVTDAGLLADKSYLQPGNDILVIVTQAKAAISIKL